MIPKKIHYCWIGGNPLPKSAKKCIASWKKYCPDYEIIEWNEDNCDLSAAPLYVQQAYELKKWAFVTDYVRLQVVYENGGVYLDTDVELLKSLDELLTYEAYFGFEGGRYVATGLGFGAKEGTGILREMMDDYNEISFVNADGTLDITPCPQRNTEVLLRHGLVQNGCKQLLDNSVWILPTSYMCPMNYETGLLTLAPETVSIHHYGASWHTLQQTKMQEKRWRFFQKLNASDYFQKKYQSLSQADREKKMNELWQKKVKMRKKREALIENIRSIPRKMLRSIIGDQKYEQLKARIKK